MLLYKGLGDSIINSEVSPDVQIRYSSLSRSFRGVSCSNCNRFNITLDFR
jgi:hypothetical protein